MMRIDDDLVGTNIPILLISSREYRRGWASIPHRAHQFPIIAFISEYDVINAVGMSEGVLIARSGIERWSNEHMDEQCRNGYEYRKYE